MSNILVLSDEDVSSIFQGFTYTCVSIDSNIAEMAQVFKPTIIVAMGEQAMSSLKIQVKPILQARGKFYTCPWLDIPVFYILTLGYVQRYPEKYMVILQQDIETLHRKLYPTNIEVGLDTTKVLTVTSENSELHAIVEACSNAKYLAVDVETTGLEWWLPEFKPTYLGLTWDGIHGVQIDCRKSPELLGLFLNIDTPWVVHNAGFEALIFNLTDKQIIADTQILSFLENQNLLCSLEASTERLLGVDSWKGVPSEDPAYWQERNKKDILYTYKLYEKLNQVLDTTRKDLHKKLLLPATIMLSQATERGVYVDQKKIDELRQTLEKNLEDTYLNLLKTGWPDSVNPNSSKQVGWFLYKYLNLPVKLTTPGGSNSTSEDALLELRALHPCIDILLKYREIQKQLSTYTTYDTDITNNVHSRYNLTFATSGRTSSSNPNLQNIPRDARFKNLFPAIPNTLWVGADLSQIELRVAAWISQDPMMLQSYNQNLDIHTLTAERVLNLNQNQYTKEEWKQHRFQAKAINFGFLYGAGPKTFKQIALQEYGLSFTDQESSHFRNQFFNTYPNLKQYHKTQEQTVCSQGFVISPVGRVFHLPSALVADFKQRGSAIRKAINFPIQSFASDFFLMGCVELWRQGIDQRLFVHDFTGSYVDKNFAEDLKIHIVEILKHPPLMDELIPHFNIPIEVEASIGHTWGEV